MQAHCPEQPVAVLNSALPASSHPAENESNAGHILYQGAIVVAILVFLLSFWSC